MNTQNLSRFYRLSMVLLVAAMLAVPSVALAQKKGGTLVYMVPSSGSPSLDGHRESTFATVQPTAPFYSLLIQVDPRSKKGTKISGDLAASWKISKDQKTYTFKIRKGVKFHNGTPLTSRDVLASWNKIIFPPKGVISIRQTFFRMVDSISTPDAHTIVFKLKFASPAFFPAMAMPYNYIYSADILKKDMHWHEKNVMGSGPFKFVEYVPGGKMVGVRNEDYYLKGQPYLDGFEAIYSPKQSVQVQAIRGGRAHSMFRGLPPAAEKDLVKALGKGVTSQKSTWNCVLLITPNSKRKPFDDERVRRALSLSLDRWGGSKYLSNIAIVKTVGGISFPGHPLSPSNAELQKMPGYWTDMKKSRAEAKRLLKEAGQSNLKFTFNNRNTDQPYKVVGTWAIDQWRRVGITATQETVPTAEFWKRLRANPGNFQVTMDFNCQALVNPTVDTSKFLSASKANYANYSDPVYDKMFDEQLRETNPKKQKAILLKMQQRMAEKAWTFPTLWWHRTVVHSSKMKFWEVTPSHYLNMGLAHVWLDQ